jgi:AcrR family transcriptional regulator
MATQPRKRLTAVERRSEILDAALAVFAERGYHVSSIDDIARAAGVSKALIYEHFTSKQQLHANLIEVHAGELFRRISEAVEEVDVTSGAARLEAGLDAYFVFVEERQHAWRILFRQALDPESVEVLDRIVAQVTRVVAAMIAQDPGSRVRDETASERDQRILLLAQMLTGAAQSLANWWTAGHHEVPRSKIVDNAMEFAWLGLERLGQGARLQPS